MAIKTIRRILKIIVRLPISFRKVPPKTDLIPLTIMLINPKDLVFFSSFVLCKSVFSKCYIFSAILNFALLARLFISISSCLGIMGFLLICLKLSCGFPKKSFSIFPSKLSDL